MRILCNHQKDKTIYIYIQSLFFISRISLFHCSILLGVTLFSGFVLILWEIELGIYWTIYITILVGVYFSFRDI
jgi:cellulose synthase/poly-beta-1,6-N-acetylglucosamine synthase-like glycosyltransferase